MSAERYKKLLEEVPNPFATSRDVAASGMIPLLYVVVSGKKAEEDRDSLDLVNRVMVDFVRVYKKDRPKKGFTCPYYEPSSTMTSLRSLFAYLTVACGWLICLDDLRGFNGSLDAVLTDLFAKRVEEYVSKCLQVFNMHYMLLSKICSLFQK